jgi:hypothetical protein
MNLSADELIAQIEMLSEDEQLEHFNFIEPIFKEREHQKNLIATPKEEQS